MPLLMTLDTMTHILLGSLNYSSVATLGDYSMFPWVILENYFKLQYFSEVPVLKDGTRTWVNARSNFPPSFRLFSLNRWSFALGPAGSNWYISWRVTNVILYVLLCLGRETQCVSGYLDQLQQWNLSRLPDRSAVVLAVKAKEVSQQSKWPCEAVAFIAMNSTLQVCY